MNEELKLFLERMIKSELKWMYHYDIDSEMFGIETDRYSYAKRVLDGDTAIENMISHFERFYPNDEADLIHHLKFLASI